MWRELAGRLGELLAGGGLMAVRDAEAMVRVQIEARGIGDERLLEAMRRIERHRFVPGHAREQAYGDHPLSIGSGQTISQPYIVALMTEHARLGEGARVLEVGTGCGYQTAVLAHLAATVYSIELRAELSEVAAGTLTALGLDNVHLRVGDGSRGWPEEAPYDAILVTCAPERVPPALVEQLGPGARLIVPVGPVGAVQSLLAIERLPDGTTERHELCPVRFVPLVTDARHR